MKVRACGDERRGGNSLGGTRGKTENEMGKERGGEEKGDRRRGVRYEGGELEMKVGGQRGEGIEWKGKNVREKEQNRAKRASME